MKIKITKNTIKIYKNIVHVANPVAWILVFFLSLVILISCFGLYNNSFKHELVQNFVVAICSSCILIFIIFKVNFKKVVFNKTNNEVVIYFWIIFKKTHTLPVNFKIYISEKYYVSYGRGGYYCQDLMVYGFTSKLTILRAPIGKYFHIRKFALMIAKLFKVDFVDKSNGQKVVRKAKYLDESFRERMIKNNEKIIVPSKPKNLDSKIKYANDNTLRVEFPNPNILPALVAFMTSLIVYILFFRDFSSIIYRTPSLGIFVYDLMLLITGIVLVYTLLRQLIKITLYVSSTKLEYTKDILFYKYKKCIQINDLKEFYIIDERRAKNKINKIFRTNPGIMAISDDQQISFAGFLSFEEIDYLYKVIAKNYLLYLGNR